MFTKCPRCHKNAMTFYEKAVLMIVEKRNCNDCGATVGLPWWMSIINAITLIAAGLTCGFQPNKNNAYILAVIFFIVLVIIQIILPLKEKNPARKL